MKNMEDLCPLPESLDLEFSPDLGTLQKQDVTLKPLFAKVTKVKGVKQKSPSCLDDATYLVKEIFCISGKGRWRR